MIAGSPNTRAKVLALGLGNLLLRDDGVGLRLVEELRRDRRFGGEYEFIDGGTQGIALLGLLEGRSAAVIFDAVALGAPPGTVHVLRGPGLQAARAASAHESSALEVLALAELLDAAPEHVAVVGIEPEQVRTGIGLSERVEAALPEALARAREVLQLAFRREHDVSGGTGQDH